MSLTAGSRVQPREAIGTIERIRPSKEGYEVAEVLWDTGARGAEPLDWLTRLDPDTPEATAAERREDALYDAVFAACDVGKAEAKALQREFGLGDEATSALVDRLRRHEGNARCGILSRTLPGYSMSRVQRMVSDAAERDSWRIAGMEPPAHLRPSDPPSNGPGVDPTSGESDPPNCRGFRPRDCPISGVGPRTRENGLGLRRGEPLRPSRRVHRDWPARDREVSLRLQATGQAGEETSQGLSEGSGSHPLRASR